MQNWQVSKEIYSENTKANLMQMGDFLYGFWKPGEWKLMLPSNFVVARKNYYEHLIGCAHVATAHDGVEKTIQYLIYRYQSESLSAVLHSFVACCDTCH